MSKINNIKEAKKNLDKSDLVFLLDLETGLQHIYVSDKLTVPDGLTAPFRLAVHLNSLIEEAIKAQEEAGEGQTLETVAENSETEN